MIRGMGDTVDGGDGDGDGTADGPTTDEPKIDGGWMSRPGGRPRLGGAGRRAAGGTGRPAPGGRGLCIRGGTTGKNPGGPDGAHTRSLPRRMRNLNGPKVPPKPRGVYIPGARSFSWEARDDNGDDLIYSIYIRRQGEDAWNPLKLDLTDDYYTLDGAAFADGTYAVKVAVSDRLSNPPDQALQSEMVSKAFTISNAGPRLELSQPQITARDARIEAAVETGEAMLHQAEYQLDGGEWIIVLPEDGITDGRSEKYSIQLQGLAPGDRAFSLRVVDSVGNITTRRTILRVR